jgi:hypothetical protein
MRTIIIAVVLVAVTAGAVHATPDGCQRTLIKESRDFSEKAMRVRQQCEDLHAAVGWDVDFCLSFPENMGKLAALEARFRNRVEAMCGGGNRICNASDTGNDADETLASIGWDIGVCPDFESSGCSNAIADCDDIADCILCVSKAAQSQALALYYDALNAPPNDVNRCQRAIGAREVFFFREKIKALATCERKVLSGSLPGPCPDLETQQKIDALELRTSAKICRECGGGDRVCGGADDRTPTEIGFTSACPNVTIPGGAACGGAIASLGDIVACADCITEFKVDCLDALAMPAPRTYPAECNRCGSIICPPGTVCCNPLLDLCAQPGEFCVQ